MYFNKISVVKIITLILAIMMTSGCATAKKPQVGANRVKLSRDASALRFVVTYSDPSWTQKGAITEENFRINEKNYKEPKKQKELVKKALKKRSYPFFKEKFFVFSDPQEEKAMFDRLANGSSKGRAKIDSTKGFRKLGVASKAKVANIWSYDYYVSKIHLDRGKIYVQVKNKKKGVHRVSMELEDIYPFKNRFIFYGSDGKILREIPVEMKKGRLEAKN